MKKKKLIMQVENIFDYKDFLKFIIIFVNYKNL